MGRGYGRATANEHAGLRLAGRAPARIRRRPGPGRPGERADSQASSGENHRSRARPSAPARETSSVSGPGTDQLRSSSYQRPIPDQRPHAGPFDGAGSRPPRPYLAHASGAPCWFPSTWRHSDVDLLAMLGNPEDWPRRGAHDQEDSSAPAEPPLKCRVQAADSSRWSSGDRPLVPSSDDLAIASAIRADEASGGAIA